MDISNEVLDGRQPWSVPTAAAASNPASNRQRRRYVVDFLLLDPKGFPSIALEAKVGAARCSLTHAGSCEPSARHRVMGRVKERVSARL